MRERLRRAPAVFAVIGLCAMARAGEPPKPVAQVELSQLLPGQHDIVAGVAFITDTTIAVGLRPRYTRQSELTLLEWKNGELRPVASTRDYGPDVLNLHRAPGGILAIGFTGSAFLYSTDLSSKQPVGRVHGISPSGQILARWAKHEWQLRRFGSKEEAIRSGHDKLLSFSDDAVVLQEENALRIETLDGTVIGSFRTQAESKCFTRVHVLSHDRLYLGGCKGIRIVDFNGNTKLRLRRASGWSVNNHGFDPASADGNRFLSVNLSRKVSFLRRAGEFAVAITTFGMGVSDEEDNREEIRVVDTTTGAVCFDRLRAFPMGTASSFQNVAAISPSGEFVAIASDGYLSIYRLPAVCGGQN